MRSTRPERATVQSSELARNAVAVFAAAEESAVRVTRRDGESFVLDTEERVTELDLLLEIASQLIAASLDDEPLTRGLSRHYPWIAVLDPDEQRACVDEIVAAARAAFSLRESRHLLTVIASWRSTAEAIAGGVRSTDVTWLDLNQPVVEPVG